MKVWISNYIRIKFISNHSFEPQLWWGFSKTHWGRVTHICVSKLTIIRTDNGPSPGRRQAIIWINAGILLTGPWGTNVSEILIVIHTFSLKKTHLKMSGKWRPFCLGLNVLAVVDMIPWMSNYIPHQRMDMINYPCFKLNPVSKRDIRRHSQFCSQSVTKMWHLCSKYKCMPRNKCLIVEIVTFNAEMLNKKILHVVFFQISISNTGEYFLPSFHYHASFKLGYVVESSGKSIFVEPRKDFANRLIVLLVHEHCRQIQQCFFFNKK